MNLTSGKLLLFARIMEVRHQPDIHNTTKGRSVTTENKSHVNSVHLSLENI
jgi:hypothetical protein